MLFKRCIGWTLIWSLLYSNFAFAMDDSDNTFSIPIQKKIQTPIDDPLPDEASHKEIHSLSENSSTQTSIPLIQSISVPIESASDDSQELSSSPSQVGSQEVSPGHSSPEHSTSSGSPRSGPDTEQEDQDLEQKVPNTSSSLELQELVQINPILPVHKEGTIQVIDPALLPQSTQSVIENSSNMSSAIQQGQDILFTEDKDEKGKGQKLKDEKNNSVPHSTSLSPQAPGEKTPLLGNSKSSSQRKLKESKDEASILISEDSPATSPQKQSFASAIVESITDFIKSKVNTKEEPEKTPIVDSSSLLLPNDQEDSDSDAAAETPDGKGLEQQNQLINQEPNQCSLRELDDLSVSGKSWVLLTFNRPELVPDFLAKTTAAKPKIDSEELLSVSKNTPLLSADDDPEKGKKPFFLSDLPEKAKAQLLQMKRRLLDEKLSCGEIGAIVWGTFVGIGVAIAMPAVYTGGLVYLVDRYHVSFVEPLIDGSDANNFLAAGIIISILPDAIARNISLWKKAFNHIKEEGKKIGRTLITGLSSILPSLIEPSYLILTEEYSLKFNNIHNIDNQYGTAMIVLCPILFMDSMVSNFDMAWEMCDGLQEWAETSPSIFARFLSDYVLHTSSPSLSKPIREDFHRKLTQLQYLILKMPEKQLTEIYKTVFDSRDTIQRELPELEEDNLETAQSFLVLRYLLDYGNQVKAIPQKLISWYDAITDTMTYGGLVLGSPARLLTLQLIIQTICELFSPHYVAKGLGWGFGIVGFPIQTALEYMGMRKFFHDFVQHDEPNGHASHPKARITAQTAAAVLGLVFTVPLLVLSFQVCDEWSQPKNPLPNQSDQTNYSTYYGLLISAMPFLFSEFATQVTQFHNSYNRQAVTTATNIHNRKTRKCCNKEPRTDYKRDRLVQFAQQQQNKISSLLPITLMQLHKSLNFKESDIKENF